MTLTLHVYKSESTYGMRTITKLGLISVIYNFDDYKQINQRAISYFSYGNPFPFIFISLPIYEPELPSALAIVRFVSVIISGYVFPVPVLITT